MGPFDQLTGRYNPHSIEKQARQWPVLISEPDLSADIKFRIEQLWELQPPEWASPFSCKIPISKDLQNEYGTDACRLAEISANAKDSATALLESSFKWLARLHNSLSRPSATFSVIPWLEAAMQTRDHVLIRQKKDAALALVRLATKLSPPGSNLDENARSLVIAALYPFTPVIAMSEAQKNGIGLTTLPALIPTFTDLVCVRFALESGGWHQKVFSRKLFSEDPIAQLRTLKWVNQAIGNREARLQETEEGKKICFL